MPLRPELIVTRSFETGWGHCDFNAPPFSGVSPQSLSCFMGDKPEHRPLTQFKIIYDNQAISLIYRVEDFYVRAVASNYQEPVYQDSCVEFFFSPQATVSQGYFNLEINCCGTALFEFHPGNAGEMIRISETDFSNIKIVSTLKGPIDPEFQKKTIWSVAVCLPYHFLSTYCPVTIPEPGKSWRANFHKCADNTSHPHWLTWAKVDYPTPKFHLPEFFGILKFL